MKPTVKKVPGTFSPNAQALANANPKARLAEKMSAPTPFQMVGSGVRRFGRIVASPFKWAGGQIAKEMQMDEAKDKKYKAAGAALNKSYSSE